MLNTVLVFNHNRRKRGFLLSELRDAVKLVPLVLSVLAAIPYHSVMASQVVLQDIKIAAKGKDTDIDIDLGVPLEYVKHFPQSFGEIIQIQLKLGPEQDREIHKEVRQGSDLQPPAGRDPLLIYVTYEEGVPGGPYLTLRFVKPVRFRVEAQKNLTTLSVAVFGEAPKVTKMPDLKDKPGDEPTHPSSTALATDLGKPESDLGQLMAKARQALTFGDNEGAIRLLRKIISVSGNPHEQDARELLGLALERSGQIPRAKFEYKKYLEIYKEGAGPTRVQQRLSALENIGGIERREKLRVAKRSRKVEEFKVFGRLSQDYSLRTVELNSDDPNDNETTILGTVVRSQRVSTYGTVRSRYRTDDRTIQAVVVGNYNYGTEKYDRKEGRLSDLYLDWDETDLGLKAVVGRQRANSSGVFDRYDGVDLGYRVVDGFTPHVLAGQNVSYYDLGYNKKFTAVRTELGKRKSKLTGNAFAVAQDVDGVTDRQALGGDFRYSAGVHSFFGGVDYDVYFNALNLMNLRWGWQLSEKSRVNLSYDYRKLIMFSTALYNMNVYTGNTSRMLRIDELTQIFSEERAKELAKNRSSESTSITIGNTYQIDKTQQLNFDLSVYRSAPYDRFEFTQDEKTQYMAVTGATTELNDFTYFKGSTSYNLTAQYIANDWFAPKDLHIIGVRYNKYTGYYNDYSLFWNGRLSPWFGWNPRPRLNIGFRQSTGDANVVVQGDRILFSPSLKLDHRWKKDWVFETELGFDGYYYLVDHNPSTPYDQRGWFFRVGYYYTF